MREFVLHAADLSKCVGRFYFFTKNKGYKTVQNATNTAPEAANIQNETADLSILVDSLDPDTCGREILAQLRAIALADTTHILRVQQGELSVTETDSLTPAQRAAIAAIEKGPGGIKIKFYDKLKALELLAKCVGLFERPPLASPRQQDLLRAIRESTREVIQTDELQELQQTPIAGDDLVE